MEDFDARIDDAMDELLRFEPPLMHFRRTALEDYELGGETIKAGDKVVLWYVSGNRDEDVFDRPTPSTSRAPPTRTWRSAAAARTTASATRSAAR